MTKWSACLISRVFAPSSMVINHRGVTLTEKEVIWEVIFLFDSPIHTFTLHSSPCSALYILTGLDLAVENLAWSTVQLVMLMNTNRKCSLYSKRCACCSDYLIVRRPLQPTHTHTHNVAVIQGQRRWAYGWPVHLTAGRLLDPVG